MSVKDKEKDSFLNDDERFVFNIIKLVFRGLWSIRITVFWAIGFLVCASMLYMPVIALVVLIGLAVWKVPALWGYMPVYGDFSRIARNHRRMNQMKSGTAVLRQMGLVPDDGLVYPALLTQEKGAVVLTVESPIAGLSSQRVHDAAKTFKYLQNAETVVLKIHKDGVFSVHWITENPLDETFILTAPPALDEKKMLVKGVAVDDTGSKLDFGFKEVSGVIVGGMPGSGKTAGVTSFLTPLALSSRVELTVIDGKGGTDWSSYAPVAKKYVSVAEDEDAEKVVQLLRDFKAEMVSRLGSLKEQTGSSNFWAVPLENRPVFKLIVIDECQEIFHPVMKDYKLANNLGKEAEALITTLVKRGRSAGVCVMLITQKLTADALPTAVRDNCAKSVCFRVSTPEAETAVLGSASGLIGVPRATEIPENRRGGAVIASDSGARSMVRFGYLPEQEQEKILARA